MASPKMGRKKTSIIKYIGEKFFSKIKQKYLLGKFSEPKTNMMYISKKD